MDSEVASLQLQTMPTNLYFFVNVKEKTPKKP